MITVLPELLARRAARSCCSCRWRTSSARWCSARRSTPGTVLGHTPDVKNLIDDLADVPARPSCSPCPACSRRSTTARGARPSDDGKGKIFDAAAATAVAWSEACDAGGPGVGLRLQHALFDKLVYSKLRAALGGQVRAAVSGGAPLGERLGHFFRGIGVPVLEGYGLTETTGRDRGEHACGAADRHGRPAAARAGRAHRRRRRDPGPRPDRVPRLLRTTRRHRRGARPTAGSTPATSASSTRTASCASPAARRRSSSPPAARTSRPPCSRTACGRTR